MNINYIGEMVNLSPNKVVFENPRFSVTNKIIGEGGSGTVYRGFSKYTESPVAVKTVSDRIVAQMEVSGLQFEIPHAVRFRDEFEGDDEEYSIVMDEIFGKNISEAYLSQNDASKKLTLKEIKAIACQLFEVLEDLEDKNLINYDIKPENLIWNRAAHVLTVVDLASLREVDESYETGPDITVDYLGPEVILEGEVDCSYNIWSTGCILFELIVGEKLFTKHPQHIEEYDFILQQIVQQLGKPTASYLKSFARAGDCFNENRECVRVWQTTARQPWSDQLKAALLQKGASEEEIQQWTELLGSMLRYENRATPQQLLASPFCESEIKVHLLHDRMNKCMMYLRGASKADDSMDLEIDFQRDKNHCLHIPRDPNDQYILMVKNAVKETQVTLTLKSGETLNVSKYQQQIATAKKTLFDI